MYGANSFALPAELFATSATTVTYGPEAFYGMHPPVITSVDSITEYSLKKKEQAMAEKASKADRAHRYGVKSVQRDIQKANPVKFTYGTIELHAMPVPRTPHVHLVNIPVWLPRLPRRSRPVYNMDKWSEMTGYTRDYLNYHAQDEMVSWEVWHDRFAIFDDAPPFPRPLDGTPMVVAPGAAGAPQPPALPTSRRAPPLPPSGAGAGAGAGASAAPGLTPAQMGAAQAAAVNEAVQANTEGSAEASKQAELDAVKLTKEPFDVLTVTEWPVPSRAAQAIVGLVCGMSVDAKVRLLVECCVATAGGSAAVADPSAPPPLPAASWSFVITEAHAAFKKGHTLSMSEVIAVALYADIKTEQVAKVTGAPLLTRLVDVVCADKLLVVSAANAGYKRAVELLWGVVLRAKLATRGVSQLFGETKLNHDSAWIVLGVACACVCGCGCGCGCGCVAVAHACVDGVFLGRFVPALIAQHRRLKNHIMGGSYKDAKKAGALYNPARETAMKFANGDPVVKIRDLVATVDYPLYLAGEMEQRANEKEMRILYKDKGLCTSSHRRCCHGELCVWQVCAHRGRLCHRLRDVHVP